MVPTPAENALPDLELWTIRVGPDGLAKVSARFAGHPDGRTTLVAAEHAEAVVLADWKRFHLRKAGFRPTWGSAIHGLGT